VWLIKPCTDKRDGEYLVKSRIGLSAKCTAIAKDENVFDTFQNEHIEYDVVIADECQFFSPAQIDQLRRVVDELGVPVLCFGLRADFMTKLFPGSHRLFEIADSVAEIKTICECGSKAIVNARISDGRIVTEGEQVMLGGNESYVAMCHKCWQDRIKREGHHK
jgi:thymidine kinase